MSGSDYEYCTIKLEEYQTEPKEAFISVNDELKYTITSDNENFTIKIPIWELMEQDTNRITYRAYDIMGNEGRIVYNVNRWILYKYKFNQDSAGFPIKSVAKNADSTWKLSSDEYSSEENWGWTLTIFEFDSHK